MPRGLLQLKAHRAWSFPCQEHFSIPIWNPFRFIRFAIEIDNSTMAYGFHRASLLIHKALDHLEAGVTHFGDLRLAGEVIMKTNRRLEVELDVNKDVLEGQPVNLLLEGMFKKTASTHVEIMALRPVVHVVVRIKVAHTDLDRTREHIL